MFSLAKAADWECDDLVLEAATRPFMCMPGTEIVEDGFRILRHAETLESGYNKKVSNKRKWSSLVESDIRSDAHRYQNLPWRDQKKTSRRDVATSFFQGTLLACVLYCCACSFTLEARNKSPGNTFSRLRRLRPRHGCEVSSALRERRNGHRQPR